MEEHHLLIAERNIAKGEARVERQAALLEQLRSRGADTGTAERFLDLLRQTLAGWIRERDLIRDVLEQ